MSYVSTVNEQGAQLWMTPDGQVWSPLVGPGQQTAGGFGTPHNRAVNALCVFHDRLYAGTQNPQDGGERWRWERQP